MSTASLVVASCRLPAVDPGSGRVIGSTGIADDPATAARLQLVADHGGCWLGKAPADGDDPGPVDELPAHLGAALWLRYHGLPGAVPFDQWSDTAFRLVNRSYADAIAIRAAPGAHVWVTDYELQLVPGLLRRARPDLRIGMQLPIPFPAPELFRQLPAHPAILGSLHSADLVGFATEQAAENFEHASRRGPGRGTRVGVYQPAADVRAVAGLAAHPSARAAARALRQRLGSPATVMLSIAPATSAHGLAQRLRALDEPLARGRFGDVAIVQIVQPSPPGADPEAVDEVAQAVARLNGRHGRVGRLPVHSVLANPGLLDRVVYYLAADVLLATPLNEAATTTALEFVAAARPDAGLVLSEFSGTADLLPDAYRVNPHDDEAVRAALDRAVSDSPTERGRRLLAMREHLHQYDNHAWARRFLDALREAGSSRRRPRVPWALNHHRVARADGRSWHDVHIGRTG